jgi:hypothetical protein
MDIFISKIAGAHRIAKTLNSVPACVAVFLFSVVHALWPSNRKKLFTTAAGHADRSSKP